MPSLLDMTGKRCGKWTVLKRVENNKHGNVRWLCHCDCGNEKAIYGSSLNSGYSKSCRSCSVQKDMTGKRFGRLRVLGYAKVRNRQAYWFCQCDCGNKTKVMGSNLRNGTSQSCGCLHKEIMSLQRGENHPNWDSNLTDEDREIGRNYPEYWAWRKGVYERDQFICQVCNARNSNIVAHHLYNYASHPEYRTDVDNGVILCREHHTKFHQEYGSRNNTPEQFREWKKIVQARM